VLLQRNHAAGWGLELMYAVHLNRIGKPVVDFLLVIIEHIVLRVMVEVLQANTVPVSIASRCV